MIKKDESTLATLSLDGLDGSNPLAFLTALGLLRSMETMFPERIVKLGWRVVDGVWRAFIQFRGPEFEQEELADSLAEHLESTLQLKVLNELGDNLTMSPGDFHTLSLKHLFDACSANPESHVALQYLACFGTDATHQPHSKDRSQMQDTALRTMSGAGHQHFLKFMRDIIADTSAYQIYATLFDAWTYSDNGRGMNLRWDPIDDRRYAMRWKNPSSDAAQSMRGANRLAIEAIPFFATAPVGDRLETTGFRVQRGSFWSWPIWDSPMNSDVIKCMLRQSQLTQREMSSEQKATLEARGVVAVFRSERITVGKFRNFTPAQSVFGLFANATQKRNLTQNTAKKNSDV